MKPVNAPVSHLPVSHLPVSHLPVSHCLARRDILRALLGSSVLAGLPVPLARKALAQGSAAPTPHFNFVELAAGSDDNHHVAEGHEAQVLIRWGDAVMPGAPAFDPAAQTPEAQALQFGYNNDFLGYVPLDGSSEHGLLVVNHEYPNAELMFPGIKKQSGPAHLAQMTQALARIEMMAHGGTVIEIKREGGRWRTLPGTRYARRITANSPCQLTGPAAGHDLVKTADDPTGTRVLGMLGNCAGGMTPWGTWLSGEENIQKYFRGVDAANSHPQAKVLKRYGIPDEGTNWAQYEPRFDIAKTPNEPNRFGWVVEIDPMDPSAPPKKRTALGRFRHEGAGNILTRDGRLAVFLGDDQRFEYIYKFVSEGRVDLQNRAANADLLDTGTLYVARYNADGTGDWLPLVHGHGPLNAANGFADQAQVLIFARLAADALGATRMDRPEDIDANPKNGKVYAILTNNARRKPEEVDAANPRAKNLYGHIIEMEAMEGDHASPRFTWSILVKCGDPSKPEVGASFNPATSANGWFGMPDNCAIDGLGRLWIATDGNSPARTGRADGIWALETEGPARATGKHFYRVPHGAEMSGPFFTPNDETFFVSVQHPGEAEGAGADQSGDFSTRWPDFDPRIPPRPSVVAITKKGGGKIAT